MSLPQVVSTKLTHIPSASALHVRVYHHHRLRGGAVLEEEVHGLVGPVLPEQVPSPMVLHCPARVLGFIVDTSAYINNLLPVYRADTCSDWLQRYAVTCEFKPEANLNRHQLCYADALHLRLRIVRIHCVGW